MKLGILTPIGAFALAAYLLQEALRDPGQSGDFLVLTSAALFALGFVSASWSLQRYRRKKRLEQHLRLRK